MKLIIKNGIIVDENKEFKGEILVHDGIIRMMAAKLHDEIIADEIIDAEGSYILPGGIDPHVHMHLPTSAGYSSDSFYTGSIAALLGGTTTLIDFVTPAREQSILSALEIRKKEAEDSLCNYAFHVSPVEFTEDTEKELIKCIELGIRSFKVYMAYKSNIGLEDNDLERVLEIAGKYGTVVAVHCELGTVIDYYRDHFYLKGKTEPVYHAMSRPPETESKAVRNLLQLADKANCKVYLVHISTAKSLEYIVKAHQSGQTVFAETCPQYLLLDDSRYEGGFTRAAPYVISPPLRKKADNEALWLALSNGVLQSAGTDHCPFTLEQKAAGKYDFRKIPNGAGGVEHRLALLYTYGVLESRITLRQFVDLTSTMPAKIFRLYPKKGIVAEGADADLVIWNPEHTEIISASTHHQHCDVNIYEGFSTKGKAMYVIRGGRIMVREGKIADNTPGCYL